MYRALVIGSYLLDGDCNDHMGFVTAFTGLVFSILQMAFLLKYSKVNEVLPSSCA